MPDTSIDNGVENLQRFIAALVQATADVQQGTETLQSHGDTLDGMEDTMEEMLEGYADDVQRLRNELDDAHDSAKDGVDGLARAAQDVTAEDLPAADESLERGESAFGARLSEGRADWDRDFQQLGDSGFRSLDSELETVKQETQASQQETEAAFQSLDGALTTLQDEASALHTETTASMAALQDSLEDTARDELENEGNECVNAFSGSKDDVERECSAVAQEEQQFYSIWLELQKGYAQEIQESFKTLTAEMEQELGTLAVESVERPVAEALERNLDPLGEELDEVESQLSSEEAAMTELELLVGELEIAKHTVGEIDELLQSIGE